MKNNPDIESIQSVKNIRVKSWLKLKQKKGRNELGLVLIEGFKLLVEAISSRQNIKTIMVEENRPITDEIGNYASENKIELVFLSEQITSKLADTEQSQGYFAIVEPKRIMVSELLKQHPSSLLLVDEIQDPGNLGTIIRSGDAAGIDVIFLGQGTVDLYNSKVIRSSMGSLFHLPIIQVDLNQLIPNLKSSGFQIIGTSPYAEQHYFDLDFTVKTAIIVGNEAKGLSKERQEIVDQMVNIPMLGKAESLNVAMATTLVLYERVRQISKLGLN